VGTTSLYELPAPLELSAERAEAQAQCVHRAGLDWSPKREAPFAAFASTVQIVREYPTGMAAFAHWTLGIRWNPAVAFGNTRVAPRLIFVSVPNLGRFIKQVLPCLTQRFVLMIGWVPWLGGLLIRSMQHLNLHENEPLCACLTVPSEMRT
jgi:hypothetical protein